eukprot:367938-Prymnesium_polylepis.1
MVQELPSPMRPGVLQQVSGVWCGARKMRDGRRNICQSRHTLEDAVGATGYGHELKICFRSRGCTPPSGRCRFGGLAEALAALSASGHDMEGIRVAFCNLADIGTSLFHTSSVPHPCSLSEYLTLLSKLTEQQAEWTWYPAIRAGRQGYKNQAPWEGATDQMGLRRGRRGARLL